eukprot:scaffold5599_cov152-Skeletonema_menzelii.AAC.2
MTRLLLNTLQSHKESLYLVSVMLAEGVSCYFIEILVHIIEAKVADIFFHEIFHIKRLRNPLEGVVYDAARVPCAHLLSHTIIHDI